MFNLISNGSAQTKKLGEALAKEISRTQSQNQAFVLGLKGDLGGGKTTFLQGLAKGLGIKEKITSPTFVLMKRFGLKGAYKNFYHLDFYRLSGAKEILPLGFAEIISNPENIVGIEWIDRIKGFSFKDILMIEFEFIEKDKRKIKFYFKNEKDSSY